MCSKSKLDRLLSETGMELKKIFGSKLNDLLLYGSYARGDFDDESDIDVIALVDMNKNELTKYRRIISEMANNIDLKYDVLLSVKLQDKFTYNKYLNTLPLYKNISKEGIRINVQ